MQRTERRGNVSYEDLMKELEAFEQELLPENGAMAMDLMVLEAKLRERFQQMDNRIWGRYAQMDFNEPDPMEQELSLADLEAMIPQDMEFMAPPLSESALAQRKKAFRTVVVAGALAVATAASVFGLASFLQIMLGWLS